MNSIQPAIVGKRDEAKERRLVPEVIEDFFVKAAPLTGLQARTAQRKSIFTALVVCRVT